MERLCKVIAASGIASRRKAEELINQGLVKVNGKIIYEQGVKVDNSDIIEVKNKILKRELKEYYLLYKPRGVITTTNDEKERKTVVDLIKTSKRIYPVGRLDYDTTGILLLTNDGELTNILTHPSNNIDKVYVAKIKGLIGKQQVRTLEQGVMVDGIKTSKCKARILKYDKKTDYSFVELTIHEGKNHQVKKMFAAIGYEVSKLKREKYAFLTLDGLKSGEYRKLSIKEVKKLYSLK